MISLYLPRFIASRNTPMFSLRISLNQQDPRPMFSSLFSPTSPCFLEHPCSLSLSLSAAAENVVSDSQKGFQVGLLPVCSQCVPIKLSKCSQYVPQVLNCVLIKFSRWSQKVPQILNCVLIKFSRCSQQVLKVFPVCSQQVLKVFPAGSPNSQLCSDQVPKVFPSCSPSSQCVPYDISNSNFYPLQV